jgi:hypothetical protein
MPQLTCLTSFSQSSKSDTLQRRNVILVAPSALQLFSKASGGGVRLYTKMSFAPAVAKPSAMALPSVPADPVFRRGLDQHQ